MYSIVPVHGPRVVVGPAVVVLFSTYSHVGQYRHLVPSKQVLGAGVVVLPHRAWGRLTPPLWHTVAVHCPFTVGQNSGLGQEQGARVVVVVLVVLVGVGVVVTGGKGALLHSWQAGPGTQEALNRTTLPENVTPVWGVSGVTHKGGEMDALLPTPQDRQFRQ